MEAPEPIILSITQKLMLIGLPVSVAALAIGWRVFFLISKFEQRLDSNMTRWRTEYRLTAEQEQRIRRIEIDFHGNGNPLLSPTHTTEETQQHHHAIAAIMNPEDGRRFILKHKFKKH